MAGLLIPAAFLVIAGLTVLSSVSLQFFYLQLLWAALGVLLVILFWIVDWRAVLNHGWMIWIFYCLAILLLIVAYVSAPVIRNTRSWIVWGPLTFQPVELAKIALILVYAQYFSRRHLSIARWKHIALSFVYFIIPAGLTMIQPDLGSATVLFGIWFGFLLVSGLPVRRILLALVAFGIVGMVMWQSVLKPYQKERILGVFYPERDALGINYSIIQSKIAIGSAGFWGKGYHQGSQTQLGFLTEPEADFVFSALIEEWGWAFGALVVTVFAFLIFSILKVGLLADQNFEKFICLGSALVFTWQFFLNTGSATGILPVIGVTFPFLSYGGSSLLTSFLLLSIVNAIAVRS